MIEEATRKKQQPSNLMERLNDYALKVIKIGGGGHCSPVQSLIITIGFE